MDDDAIRALVRRLARPHASGGDAIERSVILAEGSDSAAIVDWILAHSGVPDSTVAARSQSGLHGPQGARPGGASTQPALRFVLPAGALEETAPAEPSAPE